MKPRLAFLRAVVAGEMREGVGGRDGEGEGRRERGREGAGGA